MRRLQATTLAFVCCLVVMTGCGPTKVTTELSPIAARYAVRTLAVMPFATLKTPQVLVDDERDFHVPHSLKASDISIAVPGEVPRTKTDTNVVPAGAAETVTRLVWARLSDRDGLGVTPLEEGLAAWQGTGGVSAYDDRERVVPQLAQSLGVDALVVGKVLVYREREGSRLGAEPAIVGFEMEVVGHDGRTLWAGNYYEKQRPMTEDLLGFFERKGAFVTADELAAYGADKLMDEFPYGRAR